VLQHIIESEFGRLATYKLEDSWRDKGDLKSEAIHGRLIVGKHLKFASCWPNELADTKAYTPG